MSNQQNTSDLPSLTIVSLLKGRIKPVLLLGAGASVRSGIPLSGELVWEIAKWGYCKTNARDIDDPALMRSDWLPWMQKQIWFRHETPPAEQYPYAVEAVLRPQSNRKEFFRKILNPGVPTSRGYNILAQLLARGIVRTVLTTNFDQLLAQQCRSIAAIHELDEIKTPDDFRLFSTDPPNPQIVYLHGSVDHYTDQNIENETQQLNPELVSLLRALLRDHPLIVVGYRGAEPSVMKHLLAEQSADCGGYKNGIYWCRRGSDQGPIEHKLVGELRDLISGNLQFIDVGGFDELMDEINASLTEVLAVASQNESTKAARVVPSSVHDLQPSDISFSSLDQALLRGKLVTYYNTARLPKPRLGTFPELQRAMQERSLAGQLSDAVVPTKGCQLLFAKSHESQICGATVEVRIKGQKRWVDELLERTNQSDEDAECSSAEETVKIEGNLWIQYELASTLLSRINRPFRLKGAASQDVYPYPPLALKELLTNLLAHRDYTRAESASIYVSQQEIRFENPGGLTDYVKQQLHQRDIQSAIEASIRGIKGYRNPVIADFFFSAGAMDKEGSGLPDVLDEVANNLNEIRFGPSASNREFSATIKARPESLHIDSVTRTARSQQQELRYSPNLLALSDWPEMVWKIGTVASRAEFMTARNAGAPPFCVINEWIWTFCDPASASAKDIMALGVSEEVHQVPVSELLANNAAPWSVPQLLNTALANHLSAMGLRVRFDMGRLRAYYPSEDQRARVVTYKGLFKQATRTVTKPIISRTTGKLISWEHKAVGLRFERFGDLWSLALLPTYVFTLDGDFAPIDSERIGPLTNRRAARDYNPTVLHDIVFWSRILSGTSDSTFRVPLDLRKAEQLGRGMRTSCIDIASIVPSFVFLDTMDAGPSISMPIEMTDAELVALQSELEEVVADSNEGITGDTAQQ